MTETDPVAKRLKEHIDRLQGLWNDEQDKYVRLFQALTRETREEEKIRIESELSKVEKETEAIEVKIRAAEEEFRKRCPGLGLVAVQWLQTTPLLWNSFLDLLISVKNIHHQFQDLEISQIATLQHIAREIHYLSKFLSPSLFNKILKDKAPEFHSAWNDYRFLCQRKSHIGPICALQIIEGHRYRHVIGLLKRAAKESEKVQLITMEDSFNSMEVQIQEYCDLNNTLEGLLTNTNREKTKEALTDPRKLQEIWDHIDQLHRCVDLVVAFADKLILQCIELLSRRVAEND